MRIRYSNTSVYDVSNCNVSFTTHSHSREMDRDPSYRVEVTRGLEEVTHFNVSEHFDGKGFIDELYETGFADIRDYKED